MRRPSRQSGYSLVQILLGVVLASVLTVAGIKATIAQNNQGRFDAAVNEAMAVALTADSYRTRVTSSTTNPVTGINSYVYAGNYPAWTDASVLKTATSTSISTVSPYGTNYQFIASNAPAAARFVVPAASASLITPGGPMVASTSTDASGNVTVTVITLKNIAMQRNMRMVWVRSYDFGEVVR